MAKPSPKDIQLYVLIGLVVIAVGVVGKPLLFPDKPPTPAPGAATVPAPGATPAVAGVVVGPDKTPAPGAVPGAPGSGDAYVVGGRNRFAAQGRDPFTPVPDELIAGQSVRIPKIEPAPSPSSTLPTRLGGNAIRNLQNGFAGLNRNATLDKELRDIEGAPIPIKPPEVRVLPPTPPPYTVAGVLIGEFGGRDVAILKRDGAEGDKKFVVVGDSLEGGFTVTAIESNGVVVKHPGRPTVTTEIPGAAPIPIGDTGAVNKPKQTIIVPAVTATLPLATASPAATTNTSRAR
ncbi:MAG: hypothetical protein H7Y38_05355 [Armatimonadetes bacterium]|nr:hypothetical protein [Armatimonadota bacterium]